jgi:hypothetical protein
MKTNNGLIRIVIAVLIMSLGVRSGAVSAESSLSADLPMKAALPLVFKNFTFGPGNISGKVIDASTGGGLAGAQVCIGANCKNSDMDGLYSFTDLYAGGQYMIASKEMYLPEAKFSNVVPHETTTADFILIPDVEIGRVRMRIVLTWDTNPTWPPTGLLNDLDAHIWIDRPDPPTHVGYYDAEMHSGSCAGFPNACLEADKQDGLGPETVAIGEQEEPGAIYYYGVMNYNQFNPDFPPLSQIRALVRVFSEEGLLYSFNSPTSGEGNFWYLFKMDAVNLAIEPVNCITTFPLEGQLPVCE